MSDMQMVRPDFVKPIPLSPLIHEVNDKIVELVKTLANKIFEGYESVVKPIQEILLLQNIVKIIKVPYALIEIVKNRKFMSENDKEKRINQGLDICNNVRTIGETSGAFVVTLDKFKVISFPVAAFAKPFTAVISFLSVASIATQYRTCMKIWKYMRLLNETDDAKKMIDLTKQYQAKDPSFIPNTFNTTEEKLVDALSTTQDPKKAAQGLKDRVKSHLISSSVALVAATVSLIGTVILLTVTSPTLGWILLGAGVAVDVEQFLYHKYREYKFSQAVNLERTAWEWVTC